MDNKPDQSLEVESLESVVARLDKEAQGIEHGDALVHELGPTPEGTPSDAPLVNLKWAFGLYRIPIQDEEKQRQWAGAYAPSFTFANGQVSPPSLQSAPEDTLECWISALDLTTNPVVAARLADLLWERKVKPKPHLFARRAIEEYLNASAFDGNLHALSRGDGLERALILTLELRDDDLANAVADRMYEFAHSEVTNSQEERPGVSVPLLAMLVKNGHAKRLELVALHRLAWERYGAAHVRDELAALGAVLARGTGDANAEREWQRQRVEAWSTHAEDFEGSARLYHLEKAHEIASNLGIADRARELLVEMQEVTPSEGKPITASVEVPADEIGEWIDGLLDGATWESALAGFGSLIPTDHERDLATAREIMSQSVVAQIFTPRIIDDHVTIRVMDTPEKQEEYAHIRQERHAIDFHMRMMYSRLLDRIIEDIGLPGSDELAAFFETPIVYPAVAARVGKAFEHYQHERFEECTCILMPWLEAAVRRLCIHVRIPVSGPPRGEKDGGYIGLGALLGSLQGVLDESDRRYLRNLLCDPAGFNLRNHLAHGRLDRIGKFHALAVLHVACVLRNYSLNTTPPESDQ
ncbi:MAG: DUF4209 domain-containing protein [Thermoleophilia bacterium]|nr:DUF4209 domain-containing protein [Thermoleophilia bacterium]